YFLGRRQGVLAAVVAVLMVTIYAVLNPGVFAPSMADTPELSLFLWGAFTILTAFVVGTLYDMKTTAVSDLKQAYEGILEILAKFIDAVDKYTNDHSVRVADLAAKIALVLNLPNEEIENIRVSGLLHDIGKVDLSLEVLRKASSLNDEEWAHVKTHTKKGRQLLSPVGGLLRDVVPLVECHHENFDGSGYQGMAGEDIPLGARILAVADAYDSMITDRPYRTGRTPVEAMSEVERCAGSQFDPVVVEAFKTVMKVQAERS
ncbi:MAG: HD-GYP domain-containing protein, partial [Actinobacteria bacterium]